jgi:Leucine-rich repeat (LRR) protein
MRGYFYGTEEVKNDRYSDYLCILRIENPFGRDDFSQITGTHYDNLNDANVTSVYGATSSDKSFKLVPRVICDQFSYLIDIHLDNLFIEIVTARSFENCVQLRFLYLSGNQLAHIADNAFVNNVYLEFLDVGSNRLSHFKFFDNLTNLKTLFLEENSLENGLPKDTFQALTQLKYLHMKSCGISEINSEVFKPLRQLTKLDLSDNQLAQLSQNVFSELKFLDFLDLSGNKLTILQRNIWPIYENFTAEVDLSSNEIYAIDPKFFNSFVNINFVNLVDNLCVNEIVKDFGDFSKLDNCHLAYTGGSSRIVIASSVLIAMSFIIGLTHSS